MYYIGHVFIYKKTASSFSKYNIEEFKGIFKLLSSKIHASSFRVVESRKGFQKDGTKVYNQKFLEE